MDCSPAVSGVSRTDELKARSARRIGAVRQDVVGLAGRLHANPETAFTELFAAREVCDLLRANGFEVRTGAPTLPTAVSATFGTGRLVLAFIAEYDSLPGMGHACGHNVIAASSVGAAIGLTAVADELDITVKLLGTPGEEGGGGKALMLDEGYFDGIHAALMIHPAARNALRPPLLGHISRRVRFSGRESHAASYPENGRNAADAVTMTQVGIGLLRQHIKDGERISSVPAHGWPAANIIPAEAELLISVRAAAVDRLHVLAQRVSDCAAAGALATGTELRIADQAPAYLPMVHDNLLLELYAANWAAVGGELGEAEGQGPVYSSSDLGNLSQLVAAITPTVGLGPGTIGTHEPEFAGFCITEQSADATIRAAQALAFTAVDAAATAGPRAYLSGRPLRRTAEQ